MLWCAQAVTSSTATENFSIAQTVQADRVDIQTLYLFYLFCPLFFLMIHLILKNRFYKICMYFASYYLDQDRNKNNKNNSQPRNSPYTGASLVYGCSIYCHFANKHFEWSVRCGQKVTTASFLNKSNPVAISYIPHVFLDKCSSRNDGRKKSKVLLFGLQTSSHNR